jgi:predicted nucleotidyltransferase
MRIREPFRRITAPGRSGSRRVLGFSGGAVLGVAFFDLMRMTSAGISSHVLRTLQALEPELRAAGVRHISVFGSVARGEDTATSDVDLALDLAPERTPPGFQFVAYIERLKQRLATALSLSREAIAAF